MDILKGKYKMTVTPQETVRVHDLFFTLFQCENKICIEDGYDDSIPYLYLTDGVLSCGWMYKEYYEFEGEEVLPDVVIKALEGLRRK